MLALSCSELEKLYDRLELEIQSRKCLESNEAFSTDKCKYLLDKLDQVTYALDTRCGYDLGPQC